MIKTIFVVLPALENEVHNVLYAKDLFIDPLLREGHAVVAIVFHEKHKLIIGERAHNYQIIHLGENKFIRIIASVVRNMLSAKNFCRLPVNMKQRWASMFLHVHLARRISKYILNTLSRIFSEGVLIFSYRKLSSAMFISKLYRQYTPALTIIPFYFSVQADSGVIVAARDNNSLTVAIPARISAFNDVFYYAKPDLLLVWNDTMKQQAISWHGCDKGSVFTVGNVKCDYYKRKNLFKTRQDFIQINNLISGRKIITIICGNISVSRATDIARQLFGSNRIKHKFQVILRANPDQFASQLNSLSNTGEKPIFLLEGFSSDTARRPFSEQVLAAGDLLSNSDLIISVASSMSLESLYFDIPNIYLKYEEFCFDYELDYMKPLLDEKGIRCVKDDSELADAVDSYLEDPLLDRGYRDVLCRKYCYPVETDALNNCFSRISQVIGYKILKN